MSWKSIYYQFSNFLKFTATYLSIKIGWCAVAFVILAGALYFIRKLIGEKKAFVRGSVWSLLLLIPFLGNLRLYYESNIFLRLFGWWERLWRSVSQLPAIYVMGFACLGIYTIVRHQKMKKFLSKMQKQIVAGKSVLVCESAVTPFSAGLLNPQIILPRVCMEQCSKEEIEIIILHEETHIRLGHLWMYRVFEWLNIIFWYLPFAKRMYRDFRTDLETICDHVTISKSGIQPSEYGKLLMETMQRLSVENPPAFCPTFTKEGDYQSFKERILRITRYKEYRKHQPLWLLAGCSAFLIICLYLIQANSYPRYVMNDDLLVSSNRDGQMLINDCEELRNCISYNENTLYIKNEAFLKLLEEHHVQENALMVLIQGYSKIPGFGGGMECVAIDVDTLKGDMTEISYGEYDVITRMFRWMTKNI